MKRWIFVILGIFLAIDSFSQEKLLDIKKNVSEFFVNETQYSQIDFCYSNSSDNTYILWIERDNVDSLSNFKKIKKHFFTIKGDWSLMQLINDGNVAIFMPDIFDSFMKIIKPGEEFIVTILKKGKTEENSDFIKSIDKKIVIVKANEINGLQIDSSIDMFNYKPKNLTILEEWLNGK